MDLSEYPDDRDTFTILGVDPGSETVGYAIIEVGIKSLDIVNATAFTVTGSKLPQLCYTDTELYHDRYARIQAHRDAFKRILETLDPLAKVCESPFFNPRRPSAFGVLMEVVAAIQETVRLWDNWKSVKFVDPPTAKKSFGAAGNAGKPDMAIAYQKLSQLHFPGTMNLDEHSIDALAIAYNQYCIYKSTRL